MKKVYLSLLFALLLSVSSITAFAQKEKKVVFKNSGSKTIVVQSDFSKTEDGFDSFDHTIPVELKANGKLSVTATLVNGAIGAYVSMSDQTGTMSTFCPSATIEKQYKSGIHNVNVNAGTVQKAKIKVVIKFTKDTATNLKAKKNGTVTKTNPTLQSNEYHLKKKKKFTAKYKITSVDGEWKMGQVVTVKLQKRSKKKVNGKYTWKTKKSVTVDAKTYWVCRMQNGYPTVTFKYKKKKVKKGYYRIIAKTSTSAKDKEIVNVKGAFSFKKG